MPFCRKNNYNSQAQETPMNFLKKIFGSTDTAKQQNEPQTDSFVNSNEEPEEGFPEDVQAEPADADGEVASEEDDEREAEHERKYNFETLRDDGLRAMQIGHMEYAAKCLSAALEYQDDFETHQNLSECYIRLHQGDKAMPILRQLQQSNPENAQLFADAAVAAEQMQDWTLMEENAQRALDLAPNDDNTLFLLARCKFSQQEYEEAERHLNTLLERNGDYHSVRLLHARTCFEQEKYDEAEADLNFMVQHDMASEGTYLLLGMLKETQGDTAAAASAYQTMIDIDPFNREAPLKLARIALGNDNPKQALAYLDDAIQMQEDFVPAYKLRADVKRILGDDSGADADEKTAMELVPEEIKGEENLEAKINDYYKSINPYGF